MLTEDRQALFRRHGLPKSLKFLEENSPQGQVLEIVETIQHDAADTEFQNPSVSEAELESWLDGTLNRAPAKSGTSPRARCSLGPDQLRGQFYQSNRYLRQTYYPSTQLPFSKLSFQRISTDFCLPAATVWLLVSNSTHFQKYEMAMTKSRNQVLGFTMRLFSRGVIEMNVTVSISYQSRTGAVNAFLHGCTRKQQTTVTHFVKEFRDLTGHPLLLPVILAEMKVNLVRKNQGLLWNQLLDVEEKSGQTNAPPVRESLEPKKPIESDPPVKGNAQDTKAEDKSDTVTGEALGVIRLTTYAESLAKSLLLSLDEIRKSLKAVDDVANQRNKEYVTKTGTLFAEKLDFLSHRTQVILNDLQFIERRAQAQQSAIYNYIAQKEARNSTQIAQASKRDSSAMKSIAVLTMVFLPGTYLASFFAMPILDFPDGYRLPSTKTTFWLYWAIAVPLTAATLIAYYVFDVYIDGKAKAKASKAPKAVSQLKNGVSSTDFPV